ncbi:hypothetical protein LEP1GSC097_1742 [Leptospira interrogans serovar Grippotyphosa str. UI 08368]|nr:hypothetical protein LEP1GSC097_1742 [Leptospira interrogans serovar Grippotyphosa str. UI 08368]
MNSTERAFYGSPFWAQKGTFFKCSNKNESSYLQKVCFSDREKFSVPPKNRENSAQRFPMGRVGKLNTTLSYGSRWKTQHNAFLWVALENSTQRFPMGRVVGLVMVKGVLLSFLASIPFALYRIHVSKKN